MNPVNMVSGQNHSRLLSGEVRKASTEARKIIESARDQAESILKDAKSQITKIRQQAYEQALQKVHTELAEEILSIRMERQHLFSAMDKAIAQLAIAVAENLLFQELSSDSDMILRKVKVAVRDLQQADKITLKLNPADYRTHGKAIRNIIEHSIIAAEVAFVPAQELQIGDCVFRTVNETLDLTVRKGLELMEQTVLSVEL